MYTADKQSLLNKPSIICIWNNREVGYEEFIFCCLAEDGHPVTPEGGFSSGATTNYTLLEYFTSDTCPQIK